MIQPKAFLLLSVNYFSARLFSSTTNLNVFTTYAPLLPVGFLIPQLFLAVLEWL